jgi:DNA repair protein RecO (recombination protein O)
MSYALYFVDLVNQMSAEEEINEEGIFNLLYNSLKLLDKGAEPELLSRFFELKLLERTGYRPQLFECTACHKLLKESTNYFSNKAGGVLCPRCIHEQTDSHFVSVKGLKILRFLQQKQWEEINRLKLKTLLVDEVKSITRNYIRYVIEREILTIFWLEEIAKLIMDHQLKYLIPE